MLCHWSVFDDGDFPTKEAFAQARQKINISFFRDFFLFSKNLFLQGNYKNKKWKNHRLLAVDGTAFCVPDSEKNQAFIGVHKNQHTSVASCKVLAIHDVLNKVLLNITLHPRAVAELAALHHNFDSIPNDSITIYDRHYCDSLLMDRHLQSGKPCLIRMKTKGIKAVEHFLDSGKTDDVVEFQIGANAYKSAKNKYGLKNKHPKYSKFKMRLIRVILSTGETEVLATNLFNKKRFTEKDFKELYAKRWGVETAFDEIKNQLKLGVFSGYKSHSVVQDIWSVFIFYNIRGIFIRHAEKILNKNKKDRTVNRNFAAAVMKTFWMQIMLGSRIGSILKRMTQYMGKKHFGKRIRPPSKRQKKQMRLNERHMTEKNYKPAF